MGIFEIPVQPLKRLRTLKDELWRLIEIAELDAHRDDYIKIEITDDFAAGRLELFRSYYPNLLSLSGKTALGEEQKITLTW